MLARARVCSAAIPDHDGGIPPVSAFPDRESDDSRLRLLHAAGRVPDQALSLRSSEVSVDPASIRAAGKGPTSPEPLRSTADGCAVTASHVTPYHPQGDVPSCQPGRPAASQEADVAAARSV